MPLSFRSSQRTLFPGCDEPPRYGGPKKLAREDPEDQCIRIFLNSVRVDTSVISSLRMTSLLRTLLPKFVLTALLAAVAPPPLPAAADTTIVTFLHAPLDIMNRTATGRFALPEENDRYRQILMVYTIECSARGCDTWDRVSTIGVRIPPQESGTGEDRVVEIGRIITPPDRGGKWLIDVTDYRSLLRDSITLTNYINTAVGGGEGYLVSIAFHFIAGEPDLEAFRVENLWNGLPVYGDPEQPIERFLRPIGLKADPEADFIRVKVTAVGQGEGNTDGAATYSRKLHRLSIADTTFEHYLWRDDCAELPGTPDEERWRRPRAGFCLGDVVHPWDVDISGYARPGTLYTVDYSVEPYVNECRPRPDDCPCDDCSYLVVGHSPPFWWIESQAISYRVVSPATEAELSVEKGDSEGVLLITPRLAEPVPIEIQIRDLDGVEIYRRRTAETGTHTFRIDLSTTPGVYLLRVVTPERVLRRRIGVGY